MDSSVAHSCPEIEAPDAGTVAGRSPLWCWLAALLSGSLHLLAFPPFNGAAAAYVFALPLLLFCTSRAGKAQRLRSFVLATFVGFWLSWVLLLLWLRHIAPPWGLLGAVLLGAVLAVFPLLWFIAARRVIPALTQVRLLRRVVLLFALAGWWVVLEWVRGWLFTGFPWLPLSASQWQLPVMLQPAAWTGHYGISFILIYFNLALLQYLRNWLVRFSRNPLAQEAQATNALNGQPPSTTKAEADASAETQAQRSTPAGSQTQHSASDATAAMDDGSNEEEPASRWRRESHFSMQPALGGGLFGAGNVSRTGGGSRVRVRVCPEFYLGLLFLMGSIVLYQRTLLPMRERVPMFTAAVVQPWTPARLKWEPGQANETLETLHQLSLEAAGLAPRPDVIVWPETSTPFALHSDESPLMREWTEGLVRQTGIPLLAGALVREDGKLLNGLFYVSPQSGLSTAYYAKRRLVPFGEYRPLSSLLPFIGKVVPHLADITAGGEAVLVNAQIGGQAWRVGSLICYEDIFGKLGRDNALAGADFLLVITNDAWYAEEAGAYQHAAHSVLRAVETRRPVLRAGNHGWSGWIDEAGIVRAVFAEDDGNIYQRGVTSFPMVRAVHWIGRPSFYVSRGDWFVGLCGVFALWGGASLGLPFKRRRNG